MKRNNITSRCLNTSKTRSTVVYENLGRRIRKGLYEGIGDEGSLLRGQFDDEQGSVDPLFQFRVKEVGVDKFDRAVISKREADALRARAAASQQAATGQMTPGEGAASHQAATGQMTPGEGAAPSTNAE